MLWWISKCDSHNICFLIYVCFCNFRLLVTLFDYWKKRKHYFKNNNICGSINLEYTLNMSIFSKTTLAKPVRTTDTKKIVYFYVLILIVFVLCQLFTYDDFLKLLESFWLPGGVPTAHILGAIIVICELFALPFLLRMRLSPSMRIISLILSLIVPLIWLLLSLWINLTVNSISNVGFFGTLIHTTPGWWAVYISIALALLAIWSSWGLWPGKRK